MSANTPHEIEVKLRFDSIDPLRAAGLILTMQTPRHFEDNWLLDTTDSMLGGKPAILRIRQSGKNGWMTYKEKASPDASATRFKKRLEIETALDDPANAVAIFERLGYQIWFCYQKYRTVYLAELPGGSRLHVMFDETPIGNFIELEGEENAIAEAVALIGVEPGDFILESYLALQAMHCQQQNKPFQDMVFEQSSTEAE